MTSRLPRWASPVWACAGLLLAVLTTGCGSDPSGPGFVQTVLVANSGDRAPVTDPNLVNPWGLARSPSGPWWVSNNGTGVSTTYDGDGNRLPPTMPLVVTIPAPPGSPPGTPSLPTGIVFNDTADFVIADGAAAGPAQYIFATDDGTIAGWNDAVNANSAILAVDNSSTGALYKGLALGSNFDGRFLYATNFAARTIEVFDRNFTPTALMGSFTDPGIPAAFAPYGIQNLNGDLFVTYARRNADNEDVPGAGNGYVDVFDTDGELVRRFASQGRLNSPWAVVQAPVSFGAFGGALIISNAGDGQLNAFNPVGGTFLGQVSRPNGDPITISGLWGLAFGNGSVAGNTDTLYFTAGPNNGQDGVFGTLEPSGP